MPPLSSTNSFNVIVIEVNTAPYFLGTPANQTINAFNTLVVTNAAGDSDIPANPLTYSLLNPPAGMTIDPNTGVITWTPTFGAASHHQPDYHGGDGLQWLCAGQPALERHELLHRLCDGFHPAGVCVHAAGHFRHGNERPVERHGHAQWPAHHGLVRMGNHHRLRKPDAAGQCGRRV